MEMFSTLFGLLIAGVLIAAGFAYVFSPRSGRELLRRAGIILLAIMFGLVLLAQAHPLLIIGGFLIASIFAYAIRRSRVRDARMARRGRVNAERLPVGFRAPWEERE